MRAAPAPRHQTFNPLPLRIAQPIKLLPHQGLLDSEALITTQAALESLLSTDPSADSEKKHEPASDIDTMVVDSLKVLGPIRPIQVLASRRGLRVGKRRW